MITRTCLRVRERQGHRFDEMSHLRTQSMVALDLSLHSRLRDFDGLTLGERLGVTVRGSTIDFRASQAQAGEVAARRQLSRDVVLQLGW